MLYLFIALAVIAVLLVTVPFALRRDRRLDEVERFHRARTMTTGWSQAGVTRPPLEAVREDRDRATER